MTLPANWTTVPVTCTYTHPSGAPCRGYAAFDLTQEGIVVSGNVIIPKRIVANLTKDGTLPDGFVLPSTDDPDLNVTGWTWRVTESFAGGRAPYYLAVPHDAGSINLATAVPVAPPPVMQSALSASVIAAAQGFADSAEASATEAAAFAAGLGDVSTAVSAAQAAATTASNQATAAAGSASAASGSASSASTSAATASTQAGIATTKAGEASASAASAAASAGSVAAYGYATKALLDADLAFVEGTIRNVTNDPTPENNGSYRKVGASGSGSWVLSADRVTGLEGRVADYDNKFKNQTGIKNGWPDPFFRTFDLTSKSFFGRERWWYSSGVISEGWSVIANPVFNGKALSRAGGFNETRYSGPQIWLDEIDATVGDSITFYALIVGVSGTVYGSYRFYNAAGSIIGSTANMKNAAGGNTITASSTPQYLRATATIPAGAVRLVFFPYNVTGSVGFDLISAWAFRGANTAGPSWPTLDDGEVADNARRVDVVEVSLSGASAKANYAVDSYSSVSASATSVAIDVTGAGQQARDNEFMGWGEKYAPAGVSFNALRIKSIARTVGSINKWRTLNIVIRTGATPNTAGSTVVAVGSATVVPTKDALTDVTILLKDPATGAQKTLTDADFSGGSYFIGVYALTAEGTPAACGEPRGTLSNSQLQSYYQTSAANNPVSGSWSATSSGNNLRLGFQHLLLTSPVESYSYLPTQRLADDLSDFVPMPVPDVVVPAYLFAMQGRECNVYLDNLHFSSAGDYFHKITASPSVGMQQSERYTWTPSAAQASGTLTVAVHDKRTGTQLLSRSAQLRAAASSAGSGVNKKVIVVGDSLVAAGVITQTMLDIVTGGDVMGVTLIGTKGTGSNKHEGRGGWSVAKYTTNFSDVPNGANPFWKAGAVNFAQYLSDNALATPDWVFIHLGINDVFSQSDDAACSTFCDTTFASLDTLIASIKAADASVKIGLMIPTPPSSDQDAFGLSEALGATRWRFKRNILIWARQLCAKYNGQEANRIYVVPTNTAYDTVNNSSRAASAPVNSRSTVTATRQNNGVHPATEGYRQIGDALWAFLKYQA